MGELNFNRLLRRSGRLFGDQMAVVDVGTGHQATYAQHLERVGRLCAALAHQGVGPRDRFAVLAGASHVYVEAWHAALAGGGVINPLNTRLAPDEVVYILDHSGTEVILVDATSAPVIAGIRHRLGGLRSVLLIGAGDPAAVGADARLEDLMDAVGPVRLPDEPDERATAVLMYTGGTTGLPKGVVLSQRAIVLTIHRMLLEMRFVEGASYLAFMPMFHIGGVSSWGLLVPSGGRVVVLPAFEPAAVNAAISAHGIDYIGTVPTMLAMMLAHPGFSPGQLASLKTIMYGAAPMPAELLDRLLGYYPDLEFLQAYGMTECASTVTMLSADDHRRGGPPLRSVGRALVGVDLEIRHPETTATLEVGQVGEIWVRCDSMLTEYWHQPDQTAAAIVDGWYRTGDAGRLDPSGYLYLADRVKDMIVTGGENVYSLEVEAALSSHPAVEQVAVVGVPDPLWGEVVHAVVVCRPGSVTPQELADWARERIAGFKVPKAWTLQRDPLPLSGAAKVLKRELRDRIVAGRGGAA